MDIKDKEEREKYKVNESNRYAFGKLRFALNNIENINNIGYVMVRICLKPYIIESKVARFNPSSKSYDFS